MQGYTSNKRPKRRKRRSGGYILLSVVLITAATGLALSLFFKINRIEVTGSVSCTDSEIIMASGVLEGDNLFFFNANAALRGIYERFPYVEEARMVRRLPGTLVITITERKALALVVSGYDSWLIDGTGHLLEQVSGRSVTGKPVVTGLTLLSPVAGSAAATPQEQQDRLQALRMILDALQQSALLDRVSAVDVSKTHELRLTFDGGQFDVLLGTAADLDIKLAFMLASIEQLPSSGRWTLDVSNAVTQKKAFFIPESTVSPALPVPSETPEE